MQRPLVTDIAAVCGPMRWMAGAVEGIQHFVVSIIITTTISISISISCICASYVTIAITTITADPLSAFNSTTIFNIVTGAIVIATAADPLAPLGSADVRLKVDGHQEGRT